MWMDRFERKMRPKVFSFRFYFGRSVLFKGHFENLKLFMRDK